MLHPTTDTHEPNLWDDVQDLSLGLTWDVRNTVGFGLLTESQQAEVLKGLALLRSGDD